MATAQKGHWKSRRCSASNLVAKALVKKWKRRIMLGTFSLSSGYYDAYFKKAGWTLMQDFAKVFENMILIFSPIYQQ